MWLRLGPRVLRSSSVRLYDPTACTNLVLIRWASRPAHTSVQVHVEVAALGLKWGRQAWVWRPDSHHLQSARQHRDAAAMPQYHIRLDDHRADEWTRWIVMCACEKN